MWLYLETETIRNFLFDHYVLSDSLWPHGLQYAVPGFLVLHYLPEFAQTLVIGSLWSHPLSPPSPALNLPSIRVFTSGGQSLGLQHQSFMNVQDWFPLGLTSLISLLSNGLSSLLQHHNSKASVLRCSTFFMVQLSHPFLTTRKIIALTRWTFVGKVMSLLFNTLSRLS